MKRSPDAPSEAFTHADFEREGGVRDLDHAVGQMVEALDEDREVFERGAYEIESEAPNTARLLRRFAEIRHEYKATAAAHREAMDDRNASWRDLDACQGERDQEKARAVRVEAERDRLAADIHKQADEARVEEACIWMQRVVDPIRAALGHTSGSTIDIDATVDATCVAIRKARAPRAPAQSQALLLTLRAACEWVGAERAEVFAEGVRESPLALVALLVDAIGKTQDSRGTSAARNAAEGGQTKDSAE